MWNIIIALIIGAAAGWIASIIMNSNTTLIKNILLGIIGGVVGDFLLGIIGLHGSGYLGTIIVSIIGACLLIFVINKIKK